MPDKGVVLLHCFMSLRRKLSGIGVGCICVAYPLCFFCWRKITPSQAVDALVSSKQQVTMRSFISDKTLNLFGHTYAGDDRGFSDAETASSRISLAIIVHDSSDAGILKVRVKKHYGETRELDDNGSILRKKTAI